MLRTRAPEATREITSSHKKVPARLCADCKQLFERQDWSWERIEPSDEFQEPYHRVRSHFLPLPRLRPSDFYVPNSRELDDGCKLCSLLIIRFQRDIRRGWPVESDLLNIYEVERFIWGLRLYDNGFIELWLGYKFYSRYRSWDMSHLVTLVPITEVGWCPRSSNPSECGLFSVLSWR